MRLIGILLLIITGILPWLVWADAPVPATPVVVVVARPSVSAPSAS
mgnify:CR=1 FL=1